MANDIGDLHHQATFQYGGKYYNFVAILSNPKLSKAIVLNNNLIKEFQYLSELNNLLITGSLSYVDETGEIGKVINGIPYSSIKIFVNQLKRNDDNGNTSLEDMEGDIQTFKHMFAIKNFEIEDRTNEKITYKFKLVSSYWYRFSSKISYSNYDKPNDSIDLNPYQIIKNILTQINMPIDSKSFDSVIAATNNLKLRYATKAEDTAIDAIKYILYRTMYDSVQDKNLKFLIYDPIKNLYKLIDIIDLKTFKDTSMASAFLSLFNTDMEASLLGRNARFGTMTKKSILDALASLQDTKLWNFDQETNTFSNSFVPSEELITRMNAKDPIITGSFERLPIEEKYKELDTKYFEPSTGNNWSYINESSKWDNSHWIYNEFMDNFMFNDSLILEVDGNIVHTAGTGFNIVLDNSLEFSDFEDSEEKEELIVKQAQFNGFYYVVRSRHKFCPKSDDANATSYRENIVLARNFALNPA